MAPNWLYESDEPRHFPHIGIEHDEDQVPTAYLSAELVKGDVIEAPENPDEGRFSETDLPTGLVPRVVENVDGEQVVTPTADVIIPPVIDPELPVPVLVDGDELPADEPPVVDPDEQRKTPSPRRRSGQ
jgi:hypothetical protein